jgi:hypothetical protein
MNLLIPGNLLPILLSRCSSIAYGPNDPEVFEAPLSRSTNC